MEIMINGEFFTVSIPQPRIGGDTDFFEPDVADGCTVNDNHYTMKRLDSTCCCRCEKPEV
jgi:hypothetical protein